MKSEQLIKHIFCNIRYKLDSRAIRAGSRDVKSSNNYELNSNAKTRNNKNINSMEIEIDTSSEKYKHSLYEDVMHGGLRVGSLVVKETPNNTLMVFI